MKKKTVLENIKDHMTEHGLKYTWLCSKVGISTGHMSNIFGGEKRLTEELLIKINKVLGTDFKP